MNKRQRGPKRHHVSFETDKPKVKAEKPEGVFTQLIAPIVRAIGEKGYKTPSPIQEQSIPHLLEGRDMIGCAQTGTGKTAAFVLPILQYLAVNKLDTISAAPRVLILSPTRELTAQIGDSIGTYSKYLRTSHTVIFGGVNQGRQINALHRGVDIVVATPGRLLDLMDQGYLSLDAVEFFVLDEADRMLDMGFINDIKDIIHDLPEERQTLFFSATMDPVVRKLAKALVKDPIQVTIEPEKPAVDRIEQKMYFVDQKKKPQLLIKVMNELNWDKVIIFTQMKHMADRVVKDLQKNNIPAYAIHGDKSQNQRTQALEKFKTGKARVLVATDIAARGIDVKDISHVINYQLPREAQTYVHRIGRTARAGRDGDAVSFCCNYERDALRRIEKLINIQIPVVTNHEFHCERSRNATGHDAKPPKPQGRPQQRRGGGRNNERSDNRSNDRKRDDNKAGNSTGRWRRGSGKSNQR